MTNRIEIDDACWSVIYVFLSFYRQIRINDEPKCRQFVCAVLWILRTGSQWRQLPPSLGKWNSVFKRFNRWSFLGIWQDMLSCLTQQSDLQQISIDSTIIRAHACAAGAKGSHEEKEALGRSKGGFSCKIHAVSDALGYPIKFILTPGQTADVTQALALIDNINAETLLADKGYDCDEVVVKAENQGMIAVIPPKSNRKTPRFCDWWLYKERHVVECMFGKLKHYRRIATRYEKTARNYLSMLSFASCLLWLR